MARLQIDVPYGFKWQRDRLAAENDVRRHVERIDRGYFAVAAPPDPGEDLLHRFDPKTPRVRRVR